MKTNYLGEKIITTTDAEAQYGISAATINYWCKRAYFAATKIKKGKRVIYAFRAIDFALFLFTAKAGAHRRGVTMVSSGDLTFDPALPGRAKVYLDTVQEYIAAKTIGAELPPIIAARIDGRLLMIEGAHRYQAALTTKEAKVPVQVLEGLGWDDAFALALRANRAHGRPLNSADKRQRVERALQHPAYATLSTRALEPLVGVSHNYIANVRREMQDGKRQAAKSDDDAPTPSRILKQIRWKLKVLALTHPWHAGRIEQILREIAPQNS